MRVLFPFSKQVLLLGWCVPSLFLRRRQQPQGRQWVPAGHSIVLYHWRRFTGRRDPWRRSYRKEDLSCHPRLHSSRSKVITSSILVVIRCRRLPKTLRRHQPCRNWLRWRLSSNHWALNRRLLSRFVHRCPTTLWVVVVKSDLLPPTRRSCRKMRFSLSKQRRYFPPARRSVKPCLHPPPAR